MQLKDDQPPALSVIRGLTYFEECQVFNRWFLPTYQASFRWTGNRSDAEDATTWVFMNAVGTVHLPELVNVVDDMVADATLEAASRHWCDRYGVVRLRCAEIHAFEAGLAGRAPSTLDSLVEGLSAEMRLVIVLRFLRKRNMSAIATQLGVPARTANSLLLTALSGVAERMGLDSAASGAQAQAGQVAAFVADLIGWRRPLRFEATPSAWAALLAATHLQAAVAGNNLPTARFVRSLEESFEAHRMTTSRRHVTNLRIWSA
ncbi:MAG TPA: sigma factor-like helix-turn-helix DNA-binding protein [Candidatus Dormibacteraeota bacterium]|nr:sigma factor-like helix-turn-helix DNA-binding protein [Candidatus Dormibacteraeota bacterium]